MKIVNLSRIAAFSQKHAGMRLACDCFRGLVEHAAWESSKEVFACAASAVEKHGEFWFPLDDKYSVVTTISFDDQHVFVKRITEIR